MLSDSKKMYLTSLNDNAYQQKNFSDEEGVASISNGLPDHTHSLYGTSTIGGTTIQNAMFSPQPFYVNVSDKTTTLNLEQHLASLNLSKDAVRLISTDGKPIVEFSTTTGDIAFFEDFSIDEAARIFWTSVGAVHPGLVSRDVYEALASRNRSLEEELKRTKHLLSRSLKELGTNYITPTEEETL